MKSLLLPLSLPSGELFEDILGRVLRLPSVASKRYLTNKVQHRHALPCFQFVTCLIGITVVFI